MTRRATSAGRSSMSQWPTSGKNWIRIGPETYRSKSSVSSLPSAGSCSPHRTRVGEATVRPAARSHGSVR